ncbi:MAG: hypothetical protein OK442_03995 [Thaumarchaeota archaeon]|nr:hypothetical protein [Nitrososphaerota archaeon]
MSPGAVEPGILRAAANHAAFCSSWGIDLLIAVETLRVAVRRVRCVEWLVPASILYSEV